MTSYPLVILLYIVATLAYSPRECTVIVENMTIEEDCYGEQLSASTLEVVANCQMDYYHLNVDNRWGRQVFSSTALKDRFDGTLQGLSLPDGLYHYEIEYSFVGQIDTLVKKGEVRIRR